jgi:hypothetical protein
MSAPFFQPGKYICTVTGQALGETSNHNPQFVLRFKVLGTPDPKDANSYIPTAQQYERTHYRAITEKTIEYFVEDLKTLGFTGASYSELDPSSSRFFDLRGREVEMYCSHEAGQDGGQRERWGIARQATPLEVVPLERSKMRQLDNLFGKHLKGLKQASAPQPRGNEPPPPPIDDDRYRSDADEGPNW